MGRSKSRCLGSRTRRCCGVRLALLTTLHETPWTAGPSVVMDPTQDPGMVSQHCANVSIDWLCNQRSRTRHATGCSDSDVQFSSEHGSTFKMGSNLGLTVCAPCQLGNDDVGTALIRTGLNTGRL